MFSFKQININETQVWLKQTFRFHCSKGEETIPNIKEARDNRYNIEGIRLRLSLYHII